MAFNQLVSKSLRLNQIALNLHHHHHHHRALSTIILSSSSSNGSFLKATNVERQEVRSLRLWKEKTLRLEYNRSKSFDKIPEKVRPRSAWQDWDRPSEIYSFRHRLLEGQLTDSGLERVFTHRSYVSEQQARQERLGIADVHIQIEDNSELIPEGRQLIEQFAKRYLRYFLTATPEEGIVSIVGYLLSEPVLADISKWIGCIDLILAAEFPPSSATLADTVPALVATIARENGKKRAENFILDYILTYLHGVDLLEIWPIHELNIDLNQYLQAKGQPPCEPRILAKSAVGTIEACYMVGLYQGPDHVLIGQAPGESLPIARKMAELDALRNLFHLTIAEVRLEFGQKAYNLDLTKFDRENFHLMDAVNKKTSAKVAN